MSVNDPVHGAYSFVDSQHWPRLVLQPRAPLLALRAKYVTRRLEDLCDRAGVHISDGGILPYVTVRDGRMLDRVVSSGWLGLAESYFLQEWSAEPLEVILSMLLSQPLEGVLGNFFAWHGRRGCKKYVQQVRNAYRRLPEKLVELYAGSTHTVGSALFSSASRVTVTEYFLMTGRTVRRVGHDPALLPDDQGKTRRGDRVMRVKRKKRRGGMCPIDVTWFDAPDGVEPRDLDDSQLRRIHIMLDQARVSSGDRVLELPSSGGQLAIHAALRGARVDVLTADPAHAEVLRKKARVAGVAGAVRVAVVDSLIPSPRQWSGSYDAIMSVERLGIGGVEEMRSFFPTLERMLAPGGVAIVQSLVVRSSLSSSVRDALDTVRAYVWPWLEYPCVDDVWACVFNDTHLVPVAENHLDDHLAETVQIWRSHFLAHQRYAAAEGFDRVFRRVWDYQLALHHALIRMGVLGCTQFVVRKN